MEKQKYAAIVLAAGSGKRMNSQVHKQYLIIQDRPVLYYSLKAFEDSAVDEIVLVVGKGEEKYEQAEECNFINSVIVSFISRYYCRCERGPSFVD